MDGDMAFVYQHWLDGGFCMCKGGFTKLPFRQ
jgi:hypothetical protein